MAALLKGCNKASFRESCAAILFKIFELNAYLESLNDVPVALFFINKVSDGTQNVLFLIYRRTLLGHSGKFLMFRNRAANSMFAQLTRDTFNRNSREL